MANRFANPDVQFADSTGAALAGAQLFFYQTGTSTKLATYSDSGLTIANPNPVVLDANGRAGSIFLQNQSYKVVFAPATDTDPPTSPIWTQDPVYSSDFSTVAQVQGVNGNPNGQLAGTQGSANIPASVAWDYTNNILYVCTTTGTSVTAAWTAVNPAAASQGISFPQGRLTQVSGTPVITSDQIGIGNVFYTPFIGNTVPLFNGTSFVSTVFTELNMVFSSSHAASTLYDIFVFSNSGAVTLATGPAWQNSGAGTSSRGSGAGTTQLTRLNGLLVNAVSMSGRNGASTYTIPANQGTYLGTVLIDATPGQVTCHVSYGQSRKYGVSNAYNTTPIRMQAGSPTASWSYNNSGVRVSNGDAGNSVTVISGVQYAPAVARFTQFMVPSGAAITGVIGIGFNANNAYSGTEGFVQSGTAANDQPGVTPTATYVSAPLLGMNVFYCCESTSNGSVTYDGTQSDMLMTVDFVA